MPLTNPDGGSFDIREYDGLPGEELLDRKVLPRVDGLYDWQTPSIDAVLISHAHPDHYGFLNYVHPHVPIYLSAGTLKLIEISALVFKKESPLKNTRLFSWPSQFHAGAFTVTPHLVDHSAFSAFAFEIEASGKRLFYSGDFRGHGRLARAMEVLYRQVRPGMDALLMEGTTLGRERKAVQTEDDLSREAAALFRKTDGAVFVYQSGQNISRAVSFFKAALSSHRCFVPDIYTAHVMRELGHCPGGEKLPWPGKPGFDAIKVWYPKRISSHLNRLGHAETLKSFRSHEIKPETVAMNGAKYVLLVRPGMEDDLRGIPGVNESTLVYSLWEGYRGTDKTRQFLEAAKALGITEETLHTSGHADLSSLQRMVDTLKPKQLVPIHTFHPDQYAKHFGCDVRTLCDEEELDLS